MIDLLKYVDGKLEVSPEITLHKPLKELEERDSSVKKARFLNDLLYIYLTKDPRSSLSGKQQQAREDSAATMLYQKAYKPDRTLRKAMGYYEQLLMEASPSYQYYAATLSAMNVLTETMRNVVWGGDSATFTVKEYKDFVKESESIVSGLSSLERKVKEELYSASKLKANQTVNFFENYDE